MLDGKRQNRSGYVREIELLKTYSALVINIPLRAVPHLHNNKLFLTNEGLGKPSHSRGWEIRNHFVRCKVTLNFVISELE